MSPTIKQKRAFKKVVEGSSLTQAMKDVGYAKSTSLRTNKLTASDGWQELMDKFLPDKDLAKVHKEGLEATKKEGVGGMAISMKKGEIEDMGHRDTFIPDYSTRHKYLDTAYKLKGFYAPEKTENKNLNVNLDGKNQDLIKKVSEEVIKQLKEHE